MKILKLFSILMLWGAPAAGCSTDQTEYSTEVAFKDGNGEWVFTSAGGEQRITFFSQCGHWEIDMPEGSSTWLDVWPLYGDDNGKTTVTVKKLDEAYDRIATLPIRTDRGQVGKIVIKQQGAAPYIRFDLQSGVLRADYLGTPVTVNVTSNLRWTCELLPGADQQPVNWVTLTDVTPTSLRFLFEDNTNQPKRDCIARFRMLDGDFYVDLPVMQRAGDNVYEKAEQITIAELLAKVQLNASGSYEVEDNYAVKAWVTSDTAHKNMPDSVLYIQDQSGRGLRLLLKDKDNILTPGAEQTGWYDCGSKIGIHLYGLEFRLDAEGNLAIADFPSSAVKEKFDDPVGDIAVARADFSNLADYANTLVRIDPVEYVFAYGCYTNYFEAQKINDIAAAWADASKVQIRYKQAYANFLLYPQIVRDSRGQMVKMWFSYYFTEAFSRNLPLGKGALTGIVSRFRGEYILQMRMAADDAVEASGERIGKTLLKAGPWRDNTKNTAGFDTGNSDDDHSSLIFSLPNNEGLDLVGASGDGGMYWLDASFRHDASKPWNKSDANRYLSLNVKLWWSGNGSRLSTAADGGEGFILRTNTLRNATGDLYLSFSTTSSKGGPGWLKIQWAETDKQDLTGVTLKEIARYDSPTIDYTPYQMPYCFRLPDEMKGKSNVVIVFRCADNTDNATRMNKKAMVTDTGTNRLGGIEIVEVK